MAEAKEALEVARKATGYAEGYLKGHRKLPKNSPGSYFPVEPRGGAETSGEVAEALFFIAGFGFGVP